MKARRLFSVLSAAALLLPTLSVLSGCGSYSADIVLKVYNWAEYIDEGGEGSYEYDMLEEEGKTPSEEDAPSMIERFEKWYPAHHNGQTVRVEYSTFGTNEDMYNEIVLGNEYDLLCPSDYMIMKLAAEDRIEPYDERFFDTSNEENYYVNNVSPYINEIFESGTVGVPKYDDLVELHRWSEYAAGYMWGTTGFVYNPEAVDADELEELGWKAFTSYPNQITAKDNVRDTYFAALGLTYQDELLSHSPDEEGYNETLTGIFNRTDEEYSDAVRSTLLSMKEKIYGFETDTGKADLVSGKILLNYAWSGDAVYSMTLAEEENDFELAYSVPKAGSNLWFDGWVMTKGIEERGKKEAAQAFVNFMAMPENAVRNSYYIGYTSVIAGEEMLDYARYLYEDEEAEDPTEYDLGYFFGDTAEDAVLVASSKETERGRLFAQYPPEDVIHRCVVMDYFDPDTSERINELWSQVKAESLDAWAIIVIVVTVVAIAAFLVFVKFGNKIDFFRRKPKKGYEKV